MYTVGASKPLVVHLGFFFKSDCKIANDGRFELGVCGLLSVRVILEPKIKKKNMVYANTSTV